ncbi:hypothetical protein PhCBS80983_g05120 [Powellomyces hirtus]|uniref:FHF complex subunit HOOK-interacting protein C-terminal domain-containing protein n=1 Tax=Powellomyces hirtus TaxID=109895 RepID=A0A507DVB2_9FUNG|nr:hypothetical protein PhCBS80983_g05120 [Powellomyces hirtus]
MDYFTKLKSKIDKLATPRRATGNLLHKFQICWDAIQYELQSDNNDTRTVDKTDIPSSLQQMLDILLKEQRLLETGSISANSCAEMFLNTDLLGQLVTLSAKDTPLGFRREVISTVSALISLLEGQSLFHKSVNGAIRVLIRDALVERNPKYETEMLELESNIATKIKELPSLLNLFFTKKSERPKNVPAEDHAVVDGEGDAPIGGMVGAAPSNNSAGGTHETDYEFPLFDHLMRYLNTEGRHGDVARMSSSLLLDVGNADMEEYLSQSDFVITVVAGLGGLFSQLPPQLPDAVASRPRRQGYASVTFTRDVESLQNLVAFAQGVVARWPDADISREIQRGFANIFLDHAVKPQLMTASDFDGTTVAVLFYIRKMLSSIPADGQIADILVQFLLCGDDNGQSGTSRDVGEEENPVLMEDVELQVRDVLISKLNSLSEPVVTGILRLFHMLLSNNHGRALPLLMEALNQPSEQQQQDGNDKGKSVPLLDPQQQSVVVRQWFGLIVNGQNEPAFENTLEAYLEDAEISANSITATTSSLFSPHAISPTQLDRDPTLQKLLDKMSTFFSQSPAINLALTGVLALLAASPALAPYLFAADFLFTPTIAAGTDSQASPPTHPSLYTIFLRLHAEIDSHRAVIGDAAFEVRMEYAAAHMSPLAPSTASPHDPWSASDYTEGLDADELLDQQFWKNVLVLNEFAKELVAVLLLAEGMGQHHIDFV